MIVSFVTPMLGLRDTYLENCTAASVTPKTEFLNEIQECIQNGRATLDFQIDGGITYRKLEDRDFSVIIDTLKKGGCIHSICVPRNNLTDIILPGIAQLIEQSDSITQVDLSANQLTADGIKTLQETLSQSQSLTHISFSQNEIGDEGCLLIILALRVNRTITHVNLSDTGISHNALTVLGSIVGDLNRLVCLHVDNPHYGIDPDNGAKRLLLSLKHNRSLVEVSLSRARLGDDSASWIADALFVNKTLTNLRLRSNGFSSVGAERIAAALAVNTTLEVLDLSGNRIGDKGAIEISKALVKNESLHRIDLSMNGICGVGLKALCQGLKDNKGLTDVCLWGNKFVDQEVIRDYSELLEGSRGESLVLDFSVHFTDEIGYLARVAAEDMPHVWF